jgi:hypothetical protein
VGPVLNGVVADHRRRTGFFFPPAYGVLGASTVQESDVAKVGADDMVHQLPKIPLRAGRRPCPVIGENELDSITEAHAGEGEELEVASDRSVLGGIHHGSSPYRRRRLVSSSRSAGGEIRELLSEAFPPFATTTRHGLWPAATTFGAGPPVVARTAS